MCKQEIYPTCYGTYEVTGGGPWRTCREETKGVKMRGTSRTMDKQLAVGGWTGRSREGRLRLAGCISIPSVREGSWERSSKGTGSLGGERALGMGRVLASHTPRCFRILRMTLGSSVEVLALLLSSTRKDTYITTRIYA